ncbi:hypothetical protein A2316_03785 [Candidatus Falkowbacteria bacterium RIFOXYB2_FULL_38_15]|uniref:Sporulation stage II protein D amidase enhancer LytB N-terminal domain-containing protein n=1 Tax=Candidatus Falkowbacteria bacterium RIFOXYA2_FULL_38_12 TaxID=1797993 RepID=A0A1F5S4K5_9BACT|nr:MAG: hypothetical protein A2257_01630 [Candidatus Falkowbacteria bacterium RIFOXYA2_FULL_38_12]OGF33230.1 MAG: hypothetical protein A2316_03785 [Candidatus Falkowbacteria bacterium RIFOXYB2_FULL_38_15]OGF42327.1 MAG: hypothetical protein A2555_04485 [Candidatus Falkowbacteria bacterium RIFOXYD2_FULL_39_16]
MPYKLKLLSSALLFFTLGTFFVPFSAGAVAPGYTAEIVKKSYNSTVSLIPGKAITFEVEIKNTGTKTWSNSSRNYISLYADGAGRQFKHNFWHKAEQPAKMIEPTVAPGALGHLKFALQAPELLGLYTAKFKLAAEDLTWIPGGAFEIPINVTNNPSSSSQLSQTDSAVIASAENFGALKLIQSHSNLNLGAGEKITFRVGFKNIGKENWTTSGENNVKLCVSDKISTDPFRATNWIETNCPVIVSSETTSGQLGFFNFDLTGAVKGDYKIDFILMNQGKIISGGVVTLPISISSSGVVAPIVKSEETPVPLANGPTMRIGLFSTTDQVIISSQNSFEIKDANNNLFFTVPAGVSAYASFNFTNKTYTAKVNGVEKNGLPYLRFISSLGDDNVFEVVNFENRPGWNTSINDNKFRGALELRYSEGRNKLYLINELSLESYMRGIAEASNYLPQEFLKALIIAARTYAKYNLDIGGKHPAAYFTLNASANDQVYRGYSSELRLPNVMKAVEETRGMMATYNGEIVVTPYFSQSDGRTRAWEEVWWGSGKPWLVSKADPYCTGRTMLGHGVGFSAYGARKMADAGKNFEEILKYYFTGIELKKIY